MGKVAIIIPARYGSSRLEGKPLLKVAGRPVIQWVYERAKKSTFFLIADKIFSRSLSEINGNFNLLSLT